MTMHIRQPSYGSKVCTARNHCVCGEQVESETLHVSSLYFVLNFITTLQV